MRRDHWHGPRGARSAYRGGGGCAATLRGGSAPARSNCALSRCQWQGRWRRWSRSLLLFRLGVRLGFLFLLRHLLDALVRQASLLLGKHIDQRLLRPNLRISVLPRTDVGWGGRFTKLKPASWLSG
jgi:hypothetical protein